MRKVLIAAASTLALAAPAVAQQVPQQQIPRTSADDSIREAQLPPSDVADETYRPVDPRDAEIARNAPAAREVAVAGEVAAAAADAILDVPIGPIVEAATPNRRLSRREREETLGERASRDDPYFRERMRDQIAVASAAAGVLVEQMAVMTPVLRRTLEDVERRMEDAMRGIPNRDYDSDD